MSLIKHFSPEKNNEGNFLNLSEERSIEILDNIDSYYQERISNIIQHYKDNDLKLEKESFGVLCKEYLMEDDKRVVAVELIEEFAENETEELFILINLHSIIDEVALKTISGIKRINNPNPLQDLLNMFKDLK